MSSGVCDCVWINIQHRRCNMFVLESMCSHTICIILAEGAIAVPVTRSGGALFANCKTIQILSCLIVNGILVIVKRASVQHLDGLYIQVAHIRSI